MFNSLAPPNKSSNLSAAYHKHEQEKRQVYEERVREVEHGCFTPLVFLTTGVMRIAATVMYKRLANLLSTSQNTPYPLVVGWLRCSLNFPFLKSSIMCVHGSRSSSEHPGFPALADPVLAESRVSTVCNLPL